VSASSSTRTNPGNFFEDFRLGQQIRHATPRTITVGDIALYNGLFGPRFAVQSSDPFAKSIGYPRSPIDDLLVFHVVFGKTVPDVSLNAVANLGYADCRFLKPVYPGVTLNAVSEVIGLRENSNKKTGIVYVRSSGFDETGDTVIDYARWVMVQKRDQAAPAPQQSQRELLAALEDPDWRVRARASDALVSRGEAEPIKSLVRNERLEVRAAAVQILMALGEREWLEEALLTP